MLPPEATSQTGNSREEAAPLADSPEKEQQAAITVAEGNREQAIIATIHGKITNLLANIDWRLLSADLTTRASYSIVTGTVIEAIAGMDAKEITISRAIALPLTLATARVYSRFRDWPLKRYEITRSDHVKFIASNMLTYLVFYCTQYAAIRYWVVGASIRETAIATTELFLASFPLGAIYGYWLDLVRSKIFHIKVEEAGKKTLQKDNKHE
jgi:hypothetical protein